MEQQITTYTINAVENDYSASMRGCTYYRFAALPDNGGGYSTWRRIDEIPGAIIMSRAFNGSNAAARHSATRVEVALPNGTLIKRVAKGRHDTLISRARDGKLLLDGVEFIGNVKHDDQWRTVINIDDQRVTV